MERARLRLKRNSAGDIRVTVPALPAYTSYTSPFTGYDLGTEDKLRRMAANPQRAGGGGSAASSASSSSPLHSWFAPVRTPMDSRSMCKILIYLSSPVDRISPNSA